IVAIHANRMPVIPVQSVIGGDPEEAATVLTQRVDGVARETLPGSDVPEHGDGRPKRQRPRRGRRIGAVGGPQWKDRSDRAGEQPGREHAEPQAGSESVQTEHGYLDPASMSVPSVA